MKKSKILKYAQSSTLMDIDIQNSGERIRFNLFREIQISTSIISKEIKDQPSYYGFLTMLHKNLLKLLGEAKIKEKKAFASAYLKNKAGINKETNRPNSDDVAKQKAELDISYLKAQQNLLNIQYDTNRVEACVRSFEQRKDMLQTLSANRRKERE